MMDHTNLTEVTGQLFDSIICDLLTNTVKANNDSNNSSRSFPSPSTPTVICENTHNTCITSPVINTDCDMTSSSGHVDKKLQKELSLNASNGIPVEKKEENSTNEGFPHRKFPLEISRVNSQSLDESVEVQEYLQEEEIGVEEANRLSTSMNTADDAEVSTSEGFPSYEIQLGRKILKDIMSDSNRSVNWPFMSPVDSSLEGCHNYYVKIRRPMWLKKMEKKFETGEYKELADFVSDVRVMVDNCILFNGADHTISKKAQKLECILEQKVALLTRDLREKINSVVSPRSLLIASEDVGFPKINRREKDSRLKRREAMRMQAIKRKMIHDQFVEGLVAWDENLFDSTTKTHMRVMWELPQLGLFLYLCSKPLHLDISQYELERCFVLSKESTCMQRMMTSLLSSTYRRPKLHTDGFMPARLWEEKLRENLSQWYKSLVEFNYDISAASEKLAIDEKFFQVLGLANPLEEKSYHELTYYQKVWIVKSICDHLLDVQKSLLDAIEKQELIDTRPHELGTDSDGNTYFYFSQFCGQDVRIYRQSPLPTVEIRPPEIYLEEKNVKRKRSKGGSRKRFNKVAILEAPETPRARDSRLRQNPKQLKSYQVGSSEASGSDSESDSEKDVESKLEIESCTSSCKSTSNRNLSTKKTTQSKEALPSASSKVESKTKISKNSKVTEDSILDNVVETSADWEPADSVMPRRSLRKIIEESKKDAVPKSKSRSSKGSAKKSLSAQPQQQQENQQQQLTESDWKVFEPFMNERNLRSRRSVVASSSSVEPKKNKSKGATRSKESKKAVVGNSTSFDGCSLEEKADDSLSQVENSGTKSEDDSSPVAAETFAPASIETVVEDRPGEMEDEDLKEEEIKEEESEYLDETDVKMHEETVTVTGEFVVKQPENTDPTGPDMDEFLLVAESIQDLRDLVSQFQKKTESEEDAQSPKNGMKKNCEKILLESLANLLEQLEPHESKLNQMLKKKRMDLRKEHESYKEPAEVPLDEPWVDNEASSASPKSTSGSNSIFGEANSDLSQQPTSSLPGQQQQPVKEKKSIFDDDFDVALLLSQGRVLRKRNNPEPASSNIPTSRSRRLLNKSSRYKSDDYLLDDRLIASACNRKIQEDGGNSKTLASSSAASSSSSRDFSSQSMEAADLFQPSMDRTIYKIQGGVLSQKTDKSNFVITNSHMNGSNAVTDSHLFQFSQLSSSKSLSTANTTFASIDPAQRVAATATSNVMKLPSHSLFQTINFPKNSIHPSIVIPTLSNISLPKTDSTAAAIPSQRIISDLILRKISNSGKTNSVTLPGSSSSAVSPSKKSSQSVNILNSAPVFLSQCNSKLSMTQSSPVQTSVSPTFVLSRNAIQTSIGSPIGFLSGENGVIFIAKNLNSSPLSQSPFQKVNVQSQQAIPKLSVNNHVIRSIPLNSESQSLNRQILNSNSMINLQNGVPSQTSTHNTFNLGNKTVNGVNVGPSSSGSTITRPGTAVLNIQNIKDLNISNLSADSKFVIPVSFSEHRTPASSVINNVHLALNSSQIQQSHSNVSSLLSLFGANASLLNNKQQGARVLGQLPIQLGQMNPGNSQQILVLTSMPSNTPNLASPIQLQRFVALPSPSKPASSSMIPTPVGQGTRHPTLTVPSGPIALQGMSSPNSNATPNSISLQGVTHQLISPGLVPVNAVQPSLNAPVRANAPLVVIPKSIANSTNHEIRRPVFIRPEVGQNVVMTLGKSTNDASQVSWLLKASDVMKINKPTK